MKKDIHPKYKELEVIIGNKKITMNSCYPGKTYVVEIYYLNHRAWNQNTNTQQHNTTQAVTSFQKKFGNMNYMTKKPKENNETSNKESEEDTKTTEG